MEEYRMEKLLLIGDELAADEDMQRFVEREGYRVIKVPDREEGLEVLRSERPAVVMVDHELGEDDGVEVLKEVREADPACEVILVTRGGEAQAAIEVLKAGALDYLHRPVDTEQLRVALGRAVERRMQRKAAEPPAILVLEDHEPTLKRLVRVLEKEGYRVEAAVDGEQGMHLFKQQRFDLILADVRMPEKDGIAVLQETKGAGADVEVIVITGYGDEEVVVQSLRDGAVNFLRKPIDIEQMLLAIQKALDFQTIRRSLAYRDRDVAIMQEIVVRLTRELELVVETPGKMSPAAREFLHQLIDALPLGIVVAGSDRQILFANQNVVNAIGQPPERLTAELLQRMGVTKVTEKELATAFSSAVESRPGTIETLVLSRWSFLVMTPLKLLRPDRTEKFVALAIRGERRPKD